MTADQARELFSEAFEGRLDGQIEREFVRALEESPALAGEYEDFKRMLELMAARARAQGSLETPNLLPGVQRRLRQRMRGRYFRDRFAQKVGSGAINPWLLGAAMIAITLLAWVAIWVFNTLPGK